MKNFFLLVCLAVALFGCSDAGDIQAKNKANTELVMNYVKAVEELDYNAMSDALAENYMGLGPSFGDTIYKAEAVQMWKNNIASLYEKIKYNRSRFAAVTIPDGDSKGDWVTNWAELTITYKNGQQATIWANTSYMVENGKIQRTITLYNEADALRQLGYQIILPDAAAEKAD